MPHLQQISQAPADHDQLGLYLQIVDVHGPIPWDRIALPEGRTRKACEVMVSSDRVKLRNAGNSIESTPKSTKVCRDGLVTAGLHVLIQPS